MPEQQGGGEQGSCCENLMLAAENGHAACVEALLGIGADQEKTMTKFAKGVTLLLVAAYKGYREVVLLLLNAGASIEKVVRDDDEPTALYVARQRGHHDIVMMLSILHAKSLETFRKHLSELSDTHLRLLLLAIVKRYQVLRADPRFFGFFSRNDTCRAKAGVAQKIIDLIDKIESKETIPADLLLSQEQLALAKEQNSALGKMFAAFSEKYSDYIVDNSALVPPDGIEMATFVSCG